MWPTRRFLLLATAIVWGRPLGAQCADGSPPPCPSARREPATPPSNSIAVLYFDNLTRDSTYAYLADGLTEDLITLLGRVVRLDVKSRYESAQIRGTHNLGPSDVGRRLRVAYFIGGSVQPGTGRIRVNAELIEAHSGRRVWGERLTVSGTDPLAVQESITTAVVRAVVGALLPQEQIILHRRATRDSAAYDLYLRGRFFVSGLDPRRGVEMYRQALSHDSTFAPAWAGIAQAWYWLAGGLPPLEAFAHVREAAERALVLDSSMALAYLSLSYSAHQIDRDFARAEQLARRAIALDPRLADAHAFLGWVLIDRGRPGEAFVESDRAWQLDSLSIAIEVSRWNTLQFIGRAGDVLAQARAQHWTFFVAHALLLLRHCAEAQDVLKQESGRGWIYYWEETVAAACLGQEATARAALDSLTEMARVEYVESIRLATAHAALGDADEAYRWIERADESREFDVLYLNAPWWWLAPIQADPRFLPLVHRLGIPWPAPHLTN
jgi:TolB-like protein/tetratricopeptide (TPR) repeat protein